MISTLYLSEHFGVEDLEYFVEAKLAQSLHGVANQGGGPPPGQGPNSLLCSCHTETCDHALVLARINLENGKIEG